MNDALAGTQNQEELDLIARIVAGDGRPYSRIVERYQERLYWSCLRMLNDPDEAEDVVQETFVRAYEKLGEFDPAYRFYTWLFTIARNRCLNILRRRKVWAMLSFQDPDRAPVVASNEIADRGIEASELGAALNDCRSRLPDEQRACFDLRHAEAFSYREIATTLSVPEGTVMSRLARAREKMRECLESKGVVWEA